MKKKLIRLTEGNLHRIVKEAVDEVKDEKRFLPQLKETYQNLQREYRKWAYAKYKPADMDDAIDEICEAIFYVGDIIYRLEDHPY